MECEYCPDKVSGMVFSTEFKTAILPLSSSKITALRTNLIIQLDCRRQRPKPYILHIVIKRQTFESIASTRPKILCPLRQQFHP